MSNERAHTRRTVRPARAGVTLVELIVAIVIIAAAMAGLAVALRRANVASADPIVLQQKIAIAESLMGEILLKPFGDGLAAKASGARENFTKVGDFENYGLDASSNPVYGIVDVDGTTVAGLDNYAVSVDIDNTATLTGITTTASAPNVLRIVVTVRARGEPAGEAFVLTGWRTRPLP